MDSPLRLQRQEREIAPRRNDRETAKVDVQVDGPHSQEIRLFLEGLKEAQEKGKTGDFLKDVDLDALSRKFDENHTVVSFSRQHRVQAQENGRNVSVPGDLIRDVSNGQPILDAKEAWVWSGRRTGLEFPSQDPLFRNPQTGESKRGIPVARLHFRGFTPNSGMQGTNPPQILNPVFSLAQEAYQGLLEQEKAQGKALPQPHASRARTEAQGAPDLAAEAQVVSAGDIKVPSLTGRRPKPPTA